VFDSLIRFKGPLVGISLLLLLSGGPFARAQESRTLAGRALEHAQRASQKQPRSGDRSALERRIAILMSRLNPLAAADLCQGISVTSDAIRARVEAAAAIAPADPARAEDLMASAMGLLRDLRNDHQRASELSFLCIKLAAFDPKGAFRLAREISDPAALEYTWAEIARLAPRAAAEDLKANPPPASQQARRTAALVPFLMREDLFAGLSLSDEIADSFLKSAALAEASFSLPPADALAVAQRIPDDSLRVMAVRAAAERLALTDPSAALQAASLVSQDPEAARIGVALAMSSKDPRQAAGLIEQRTSPRRRQDAFGLFLIELASQEVAAACEFADSHPEIPHWALPSLCAALARTDLPAALSRARAIPDSHSRDLALAEITRMRSLHRPPWTFSWRWRILISASLPCPAWCVRLPRPTSRKPPPSPAWPRNLGRCRPSSSTSPAP
jgi:hypothetical protein